MADNKESTDKSITDVQLDDFDVNRQRERLERSRPEELRQGGQPGSQQSETGPDRKKPS